MPFDIKTARPVNQGFDISTARPIEEAEETKSLSYEEEVMQKEQERKDRILSGKGNRITKFILGNPITPRSIFSADWTGIKSPEDIPDIATKINPLTLATKPFEFLPQTEKPATQFSKELLYSSIPTPAMALGAMAPSVIKGASPAFSKAMQVAQESPVGKGVGLSKEFLGTSAKNIGAGAKGIGAEFANLKTLFKESAPQLREKRFMLGKSIESEKEELTKIVTPLKDRISATTEAFKQNKEKLIASLTDDATNKTLKTREALPSLIKAETETYKAGLDEVAQNLGEISLKDAQDIIGNTIIESNASFLRGDTLEAIKKLGTKYLNSKKTSFDFRDLKADFDQILNSVEYGKRATSEAIPAYILRKQLGKYVTDVRGITEFKPLQDTYSETTEILKFADEYFKPFGSELKAKRGITLLKQFGMGETKIGEKEMLGKLQGRLGEDITSSLSETGKEINRITEATENLKNTLTREIADRTDISKNTINAIQKEIEKRTIQLNNRLRADSLRNKILITVGAGTGIKMLSGKR